MVALKESIRPAPLSIAPPGRRPSFQPPAPSRSRGPSVGRPEGTFSQSRRLDRLKDLLESAPNGVELGDLAASLQVSTRSVRRYLSELTHVVELESIPVKAGGAHVWRIKPSERGRTLLMRRTQAYGLLAARPHFELLRGSAFFDELDLAMRKLLEIAQRPTQSKAKGEIPSDQRLEDRLVFVPSSLRNYGAQAEDIDRVLQATAELRVLTIRLDPKVTARRVAVRPYALVAHKGTFVVLLAESKGSEVRVVPLHLLRDCVVTDERFTIPPDFEVAEYLQGEFTPAPPTPEAQRTRVMIEFDARVADQVRSRRVHPKQKMGFASDGRIRLSFPLVSLDEVRTWVLGFGDAALVLEPEELRNEIAATLHRMSARYR